MAVARIEIKPDILTWAVERIGKKVQEYSIECPEFKSWLDGTKVPTLKKAEDFAHKFYVPFGYMFLDTPPKEDIPITFFRRGTDAEQNVNVNETINTIKDRQDWLREYLQSNSFKKLDFAGKFKDSKDISKICSYISGLLNLPKEWAASFNTEASALNYITGLIEDKGVIITYNSVVGYSNTRHLLVEDCRGFALVDDIAPFIFINNSDSKVAQMFTLIHEFAHILLGYTSGIGEEKNIKTSSAEEQFCNKIAAEFLVPNYLFIHEWEKSPYNYDYIAKIFKVSRSVILRKAYDNRFINKDVYNELSLKWEEEKMHDLKKIAKNGGGNFNSTAIKRSSRTFLIHICNALDSQQLLYTEAYRLVGLKGNTFNKLVNSKEFLK